MIDKQAIDTMTHMLVLITKYSKGAYPEVETEASCENRRRAWAITKMLARLAEHAAESDMYFLLSSNVNNTNAERARCYQIAKQEDRGFMDELQTFQTRVTEYENNPVRGKNRTDRDIVREIELLLQNVHVLEMVQAGSGGAASDKVSKKERARHDANETAIAEQLASVKQQLDATEKLALTRGMVVSLNRQRTVIKRVPAQSTKSASAATKAMKAPVLKLVAVKPAPGATTKAVRVKKSA